jgi:excisionase family DNA binding protein
MLSSVESEVLPVTTPTDGFLVFTVPEAARLLRISRNLTYELVRRDVLPHIHLGRRILIPRHELSQWIAQASVPRRRAPLVVSWSQRH